MCVSCLQLIKVCALLCIAVNAGTSSISLFHCHFELSPAINISSECDCLGTHVLYWWRVFLCSVPYVCLFIQAYPHKILTGRRSRMHTLRQTDGLSGFTKRSESEYDPFGAGHSSTTISAGLGTVSAYHKIY
jgi:hypothetical protein